MNMLGAIGSVGGRQGQGDNVQQLIAEATRYSGNAQIQSDLQALQEAQQNGRPQGPPPPPPGMGQGSDNLSLSPEAQMMGMPQGMGPMQGAPPPPPPPQGMGQMQGMGPMQGAPPPPPPPQGQGQDQVATLIQKLAEDVQAVRAQQQG